MSAAPPDGRFLGGQGSSRSLTGAACFEACGSARLLLVSHEAVRSHRWKLSSAACALLLRVTKTFEMKQGITIAWLPKEMQIREQVINAFILT